MVTQIQAPPMPQGMGGIVLSDNSHKVLSLRFLRKGPDGQPVESPEEMLWRVACHVASVESQWEGEPQQIAAAFYGILASKRFLPNSPTFTGAGTPLGQLAACFVLPISDDMGRKRAGIFQTLRDAALIQQTGGGNGFSFSRLRPKGTIVKSSSGQATGPVGFLRVYDQAFGEVAQGGTRRGANMAVLRIDHPDIEEFLTCKTDESAITNFNISVGIPDAFMEAVQKDEWWELRFPDVLAPEYKDFDGTLAQAIRAGVPIKTYRRVRARELWEKLVQHAYNNGEPGVLFLDTMNRANALPHLYEIEATNPCGEQFLGPYESCCLGSINLAQHLGPEGTLDWARLRETVELGARFLDDVVDANAFVPEVPELRIAARQSRRIGLGIMGLADVMYNARLRYGSPASLALASKIMEFIRYHSMLTSIDLARSRGPFPAIAGSVYDPEQLSWKPPERLAGIPVDVAGSPPVDWRRVVAGIRKHGIRNAAQLTVAPTGTLSTVAGCEGYGCEPVFALAYRRHVQDDGRRLTLDYVSPMFRAALGSAGLNGSEADRILRHVLETGSCQDLAEVPEAIREVYVVAEDVTPEEHVLMQVALQAYVDSSISKTVNLPRTATPDDVARIYQLAWEKGCKGVTVYVTGSRDKVVLETQATAQARTELARDAQSAIWNAHKKPRPDALPGVTYKQDTPVGKTFVTINNNGQRQPFEVFINTAKAGSEMAAVSEALGRLISYILRLASPIEPLKRLEEVYRQLWGIGGARSSGFGKDRVRSLPDAVAQVLGRHLDHINEDPPLATEPAEPMQAFPQEPPGTSAVVGLHADLCPECGEASLVATQGCASCIACGHSEC